MSVKVQRAYCTLTAHHRKPLIYIGAGEGNRTLITGVVVYSAIEPPKMLDFRSFVQYAYCTNCTLYSISLHNATRAVPAPMYGISLQKATFSILVYPVH